MRGDRERLLDILAAIERIARHTASDRGRLESDELVQVWVVHHIEVIGEAVRGLSPVFRDAHPEVPWRQIVAMRDVLAHRYFGIDVDRVWETVHEDLPRLRAQVFAIVEEMKE